MKIFLFTSVLSGGGAERVLSQLANQLSREFETILIAAYKTQNEYDVDDRVRKVYLDDLSAKKSARQIFRLRKMIKVEKPDICISFLPHPNFKLILASLGLKTKVIVSVRNDPKQEYNTKSLRLMARRLYSFANGVVFQTNEARDYFPKKIVDKSMVIMNQVDDVFFRVERTGGTYWIATGRLNRQKNYPLLVNTFAKICKKYPSEILKIYGAGPEEGTIRELIKKLKMEENIFLMGLSSNISEQLAHAKGFLLSSDYEGMPNGLLEALAVGVPCISTDCPCGGPRSVIEDGVNGLMIPVNDRAALFESIERIICDKDLAEKLSKNAKRMAQKFEPDAVYKVWKDYILKIGGE